LQVSLTRIHGPSGARKINHIFTNYLRVAERPAILLFAWFQDVVRDNQAHHSVGGFRDLQTQKIDSYIIELMGKEDFRISLGLLTLARPAMVEPLKILDIPVNFSPSAAISKCDLG
jgi:hypothetical protein